MFAKPNKLGLNKIFHYGISQIIFNLLNSMWLSETDNSIYFQQKVTFLMETTHILLGYRLSHHWYAKQIFLQYSVSHSSSLFSSVYLLLLNLCFAVLKYFLLSIMTIFYIWPYAYSIECNLVFVLHMESPKRLHAEKSLNGSKVTCFSALSVFRK